jgi:hypothetical protein
MCKMLNEKDGDVLVTIKHGYIITHGGYTCTYSYIFMRVYDMYIKNIQQVSARRLPCSEAESLPLPVFLSHSGMLAYFALQQTFL